MYLPKEKKRYIKNDTLLIRKPSCDTVTVTETEVKCTPKKYKKIPFSHSLKPPYEILTVTERKVNCTLPNTLLTRKPYCDTEISDRNKRKLYSLKSI